MSQQCYEFLPLERCHLEQAAAVINRVLSADVDVQYLDWKYFRNPAGKAISIVIVFNGSLVGILAALPIRFFLGQRETLAVEEVDLAILEEHRRLDIYLQMVGAYTRKLIERNIAFTYGVTSVNASQINQTIIGKTEAGKIPRLVRVLKTAPFLRKKLTSTFLADTLSLLADGVLAARFASRPLTAQGMQVSKITRFDGRFDAFWQKTRLDHQVTTVRDSAYLNWRYAESARYQYEIACIEDKESGELAGYLVAGEKEENNLRRGLIMELVSAREQGLMLAVLLQHAMHYFHTRNVDAVECWMLPQCDAYPVLVKSGFRLRQKEGMSLHFQKVLASGQDAGLKDMHRSENWYISLGDSDLG